MANKNVTKKDQPSIENPRAGSEDVRGLMGMVKLPDGKWAIVKLPVNIKTLEPTMETAEIMRTDLSKGLIFEEFKMLTVQENYLKSEES